MKEVSAPRTIYRASDELSRPSDELSPPFSRINHVIFLVQSPSQATWSSFVIIMISDSTVMQSAIRYMSIMTRDSDDTKREIAELCASLCGYFDVSLSRMALYVHLSSMVRNTDLRTCQSVRPSLTLDHVLIESPVLRAVGIDDIVGKLIIAPASSSSFQSEKMAPSDLLYLNTPLTAFLVSGGRIYPTEATAAGFVIHRGFAYEDGEMPGTRVLVGTIRGLPHCLLFAAAGKDDDRMMSHVMVADLRGLSLGDILGRRAIDVLRLAATAPGFSATCLGSETKHDSVNSVILKAVSVLIEPQTIIILGPSARLAPPPGIVTPRHVRDNTAAVPGSFPGSSSGSKRRRYSGCDVVSESDKIYYSLGSYGSEPRLIRSLAVVDVEKAWKARMKTFGRDLDTNMLKHGLSKRCIAVDWNSAMFRYREETKNGESYVAAERHFEHTPRKYWSFSACFKLEKWEEDRSNLPYFTFSSKIHLVKATEIGKLVARVIRKLDTMNAVAKPGVRYELQTVTKEEADAFFAVDAVDDEDV